MDGVLWFLLGVLVGGVVGLLVGRRIGAKGGGPLVLYPPGLKPTAISFDSSVVVFKVEVTRVGNAVFSSGTITVTPQGGSSPVWSKPLTTDHLKDVNTCGATAAKVPLPFADTSFPCKPGTVVTVVIDYFYDGLPKRDKADNLTVQSSIEVRGPGPSPLVRAPGPRDQRRSG